MRTRNERWDIFALMNTIARDLILPDGVIIVNAVFGLKVQVKHHVRVPGPRKASVFHKLLEILHRIRVDEVPGKF